MKSSIVVHVIVFRKSYKEYKLYVKISKHIFVLFLVLCKIWIHD